MSDKPDAPAATPVPDPKAEPKQEPATTKPARHDRRRYDALNRRIQVRTP